jgi:hypothetical protein
MPHRHFIEPESLLCVHRGPPLLPILSQVNPVHTLPIYFLKFSFSLGRYTTVFQAEVYAIKACADENIKRGYCNRNIYILSDSQAAIKAFDNCKIYSKLVWDCHQSPMTLAVRNKVYLMWVPEHKGIHGHVIADQLTKMGSLHPFIGPEPSFGISGNVARRAIRDWVCREHHK